MIYDLHGVPVRFETDDSRIAARLEKQWRPFTPPAVADDTPAEASPALVFRLWAVAASPPAPAYPAVSSGPVVIYYRQAEWVTAFFQRWGRYDIDLAAGVVDGAMTEACLSIYGVFEDMIIIALAPLLRRRGLFTLHAFAAARHDRAALLVGDIGAGKTTTGLSLLCGGYKLCANDSPLVRLDASTGRLQICAYPGLISAYPDSISWFPQLAPVLAAAERLDGSAKLSFAADALWPEAWQMQAQPGVLLFPQIIPGLDASMLRPLHRFDALHRLAGQSIENWDADFIPPHLQAMRILADSAPAYDLLLAPDVARLPTLVDKALDLAEKR